jgi:hypothetical protein
LRWKYGAPHDQAGGAGLLKLLEAQLPPLVSIGPLEQLGGGHKRGIEAALLPRKNR